MSEQQQQQQQQNDGNNQQQQQQAKPWYEGKADAETIGWMQNKGWDKDPVTAAIEASKARREAERFLGTSPDLLLKLPKDAADEAGWNAVRQRLGMPAEAKDYDFSSLKRADGSAPDASLIDAMRASLHKAGVAKDAAPEVVKAAVGYLDAQAQADASAKAARLTNDRKALETEWGQNFEFNRVQAMQGARRAAGTDDAAKALVDAMQDAIGYKATMEFWRKIGAGTSEDTFVDVQKGGSVTTRNGAVARLAELERDPDWSARLLKGGVKERQEMDSLLAQIHGTAA